ncbi:hypothetical protein K504DRAFT_353155, partial [Pleomassaria siparia CBS 279.74]
SNYRVAEYHNGNVHQIFESRRHQHVTNFGAGPTSYRQQETTTVHWFSVAENSPLVIHDLRSGSQKGGDPMSKPHVTVATHVSPRAKPIIFQSPTPHRPKPMDISPLFKTLVITTPPPTPKIDRLPTPELDDLDGFPFCNCCVDVYHCKYCVSCG